MKKAFILASILLIIISIIALVLSATNKSIGWVIYDIFLIIWILVNLISALKP